MHIYICVLTRSIAEVVFYPADKTSGTQTGEEKVLHPGVVCDGCEGSIYGPRYKCMVCFDYDLCSACEEKGIHPEHDKLKIVQPIPSGGPAVSQLVLGFFALSGACLQGYCNFVGALLPACQCFLQAEQNPPPPPPPLLKTNLVQLEEEKEG